MKVLQLSTSLGGGAGIAARRLNSCLLEEGIDSRIMAIGKSGIILKNNEYLIKRNYLTKMKSSFNTYLQAHIVQNSSNLITTNSISALKSIDNLLEYDIIHIHSTYNMFNDNLLRDILKVKRNIFFTLHDQRLFTGGCHYSFSCQRYESECRKCPQVNTLFQSSVLSAHKRSITIFNEYSNIQIISPSTWLANLARNSAVLSRNQIEVIPNPIPSPNKELSRESLRKKFGYNDENIVISFIAADLMNPNKGLLTLLKALQNMSEKERLKYRLVLIGKSKSLPILDYIKHNVINIFFENEMSERLLAGDVVVVPSRIDNFPNVIGEALMSGSMVFGSNSGGVAEIMKTMIFPTYPVDDYNALSSLITNFNYNYNREEIIKKAKLIYSYPAVASKMQNLYIAKLNN